MPKTAFGMFLFSVSYHFFQDFKMTTLMERFRIVREEKRVLVYLLFLIQEKFFIYLRLYCLCIFRVAESKPDFGDDSRIHAGSIIMVVAVQYIYGVHHIPMYIGLLWMLPDKR